jgi:hypothetical protein
MKYFISCAFIAALLIGCKKYDDTVEASHLQVPPYTETGANTFGCLINGAPWANFGYFVMHNELGGQHVDTNKVHSSIDFYNAPNKALYVNAALDVYKKGVLITDQLMYMTVPQNGSLKGIHKLTSANYLFAFNDLYTGYGSLIRNPFTVTIFKDTIIGAKHIVSGMFNGVLYNNSQTDSLKITGGVFDVTLQ